MLGWWTIYTLSVMLLVSVIEIREKDSARWSDKAANGAAFMVLIGVGGMIAATVVGAYK